MISLNLTFLFTILNFTLLIGVLSVILWKPMLKFLEERARTIEASLELAEENKRRAEELREEHGQIIKEARSKAAEVIDKAQAMAQSESRKQIARAREQGNALVESAKKEIRLEGDRIKQELRHEVAAMTVDLAGKVLEREITEADHREFIDKNLSTMGL